MKSAAIAAVVIAAAVLNHHQAPGTSQRDRWHAAELRKVDLIRIDKCITLFNRTAPRYEKIADKCPSGSRPPAAVLFCLHYRESDNNFRAHAHNGDPLTHRTYEDPKHRLPNKPPPYTFEESAEDAYYVCDRLQLTNWTDLEAALDRMEAFNGFGYRARGLAAPYLWAGTNLYTRGKFTSDHHFNPTAVDRQLGCAAILKRMAERGIALPFASDR